MNEDVHEITVEAIGKRVSFPNREALAEHVIEILDHRGGVYDPLEVAAIQELARLNGGGDPRVLRIAAKTELFSPPARPKVRTPLDARILATEAEEVAAEARWIAAEKTWRSRAHELEGKAALRLRAAAGNPTKLAGAQSWADARRAEVAALAAESGLAASTLRMARARLNALKLTADRWRVEQDLRFHNHENPSQPLCKLVDISRLRQKPCLAILDHVHDTAYTTSDDERPACHGFEDHSSQTLRDGRDH